MITTNSFFEQRMETFFNTINQKTESEINRKLKLVPETTPQKAYGFKVGDTLNPRKIRIKNWITDRARFTIDIKAELHISPIAVTHLKLWDKLCNDLELYRLTVNSSGGVNANKSSLMETENKASKLNCLFGNLGAALGLTAFFSFVFLLVSASEKSIQPLIFGVPVIMTIGIFIAILNWRNERKNAQKKLNQKNGELNILFPNRHSLTKGTGTSIAIDFIDPPNHLHSLIEQLLLVREFGKNRNFELQVVAHPDAFSINSDQEVLAWADPIITVVQGNCVAVLAQYGNFPSEIKLAQIVANLDFLPI